MDASVNLAIIQGNLGRDPEIHNTQSGGKIANMTIATSERWKDRASGERKEKTEWIRVCVFNEALVNVIERYVKKGSTIYVEGELRTRKWQDREGVERHTTEVVLTQMRGVLKLMGSPKREGGASAGDGYEQRQATRTDARGNPQYSGGDLDDEVPF
ncbi:MAG TPA: single-stranded DNA-binding protein [Verrucomicrobiae bacterium]|nr:single-stranded DNA-binding protein [Verrucomicrobiae bacterium]